MIYVYITRPVYEYVRFAVESCKGEVGGFGYITKDADGDLVWHEAFIVPQQASSGGVDFESEGGVEYAIEKAIADRVHDDPHFMWAKWHSHGNMKTFWSTTDDKINEKLRLTGIPALFDFVTNHKAEDVARIELYNVQHGNLAADQLTFDDVYVLEYIDPQVRAKVKEDLKELVHEKKYTSSSKSSSSQSSSHTVKRVRNDDPGDQLEAALAEGDYGYTEFERQAMGLTSSVSEAAFDAAGDGDEEPWLPTLVDPTVVPHGALEVSAGMWLDKETADGIREAGYEVIQTIGDDPDTYLIPCDQLEDVIDADAVLCDEADELKQLPERVG